MALHPMANSIRTIKTLSLEDYIPDGGQVRSDLLPKLGTIYRSEFSVDFELVYEVHGSYDKGDTNNASLLVIRIIPRPDNLKRQFVRLKITLTILPEGGARQGEADEYSVPLLRSIEPASSGEQFANVFTTNETREHGLSGSIEAQIWGVSPGIEYSSTSTTEFKKHHLLRVKSGTHRTISTLSKRVANCAWWEVQAANENDGIGDSFTVALLVRRPPDSKFRLEANTDGEVGLLSETLKKFFPSGFRSKKDSVLLDTFGGSTAIPTQRTPPGIYPGDLHAASTSGAMKGIEEVGLHLPEQGRLVKFESGTGTAQSDLEAKEYMHDQGGVEATKKAPVENKRSQEDLSPSPALPQFRAALPTTIAIIKNESSMGATHKPELMQPLPSHKVACLPAVQGQVPRNSSPDLLMARVGRLREIAALYSRLADLHREEAEECLSASERAANARED